MTDALFDSPAKRSTPPSVSVQTPQPRANASPSSSVRAMSCTSANPAHFPVLFFIEGTMNAESLFASEEEAKRQTLVRL